MASLVQVSIHPSQFPDRVRRDLCESLRSRELNHKFLYEGWRQTQKWLELHAAYSPSRTDADCASVYEWAFRAAATRASSGPVHLVGLGCGGGQKDARCLQILLDSGRQVSYTPADVSVAMVLTARECATAAVPGLECRALTCDLATATDISATLEVLCPRDATRLISFFGMIPNFEPGIILPRLAGLLRSNDLLLFSANLAPGLDYSEGVQQVLPLYDNTLTREWLLSFLLDLGVERTDGDLVFSIEDAEGGLKRIAAHFHFCVPREVQASDARFLFKPGESIRLFFSYRHRPERLTRLLGQYGLCVLDHWLTATGEEGVFLIRKE